jgi:cytochrome P450
MLILAAGTDTTGTTLAFLFYELARHPPWYARLRAELAAMPSPDAPSCRTKSGASHEDDHGDDRDDCDGGDGGGGGGGGGANQVDARFAHDALQHLPILNAIVWETLRMHPLVPASLSRAAPRGGAPVAGHFMPAGTLVGVPVYTLQRQAHAFPAPDEWRPERWLAPMTDARGAVVGGGGDGDGHSDGHTDAAMAAAGPGGSSAKLVVDGDGVGGSDDAMRAHMLVFSRGMRSCIGRAIALLELRLTVAVVAQRFASVRLASEQTRDDMKMKDWFVLQPKGGKCMLVFE